MIIKSICFWIVILIISGLFMNHIFSRKEAHKQRLIDLDENIARIKAAYDRESKQKSELHKERQELSIKIDREIERGESAKLLLGANVETELPPAVKTSSILVEKVVAKQVFWDQTPAEQGLNVGDWITIEGYQDAFIGARIRVQNGINYGLEWNDSWFGGLISITSQQTAFSAPGDGINDIIGSINNPRENEIVVRINETLLHEETVLIRVTGQIYQLNAPHEMDRYPNQWGVILKEGVSVEFME